MVDQWVLLVFVKAYDFSWNFMAEMGMRFNGARDGSGAERIHKGSSAYCLGFTAMFRSAKHRGWTLLLEEEKGFVYRYHHNERVRIVK